MSEYLENVRQNEGSLDYQTTIGTATDNKFLPYLDTEDNWTIGYGHKMSENEIAELVTPYESSFTESQYGTIASGSPGWSFEEGESTLNVDYNEKLTQTGHYFGSNHPSSVMHAVTETGYNMGAKGLYDKFPGFRENIIAGDYSKAAENLIWKDPSNQGYITNESGEEVYDPSLTSKWYDQVGHDRATGIYNQLIEGSESVNESNLTNKIFDQVRHIDETNLDTHKIVGNTEF